MQVPKAAGLALALSTGAFASSAIAEVRLPQPVETPAPQVAPGILQAGHHGVVMVKLTIKDDGSVGDIKLVESSRSRPLDEAALAAVATWRFTPGIDAEGKPFEMRIEAPFEFEGEDSGDFTTKACRTFAVEARWFQQAFPERTLGDSPMYKRTLRYLVASLNDKIEFPRRYGVVYEKTLAECEAHPDAKFWDMVTATLR